MNKVILVGRISREIEMQQTTNGTSVVKNAIAVNRKDKTADFVNVTAYGKTAELMKKYLLKGDPIGIEGSIRPYEYEKDGEKRYSYEVVIDRLEFLPANKSSSPATDVADYPSDEGELF